MQWPQRVFDPNSLISHLRLSLCTYRIELSECMQLRIQIFNAAKKMIDNLR